MKMDQIKAVFAQLLTWLNAVVGAILGIELL